MKHWYDTRLTLPAFLLLPFSLLFGLLVELRRFFFKLKLKKSYRFDVPVIIVGNITIGGTGKTPLTIWLAKFLRSNGFKPGIVSRGVGGRKQRHPFWVDSYSDVREVGDEAILLAKRASCPTVVCVDRPAAVQALLKRSDCNVVISDDGLQHYALERDIEIALIDDKRGLGNQLLLPSGPLREKVSRLNSVDFVVRQGQPSEKEFAMQLEGQEFVSLMNEKIFKSINDFVGQKVHAIAAIGHPERFFSLLKQYGLSVIPHAFPDHYHFKKNDIYFSDNLSVIMTEKDAVKCKAMSGDHHWYLPVDAKVDNQLGVAILDKLRRSL